MSNHLKESGSWLTSLEIYIQNVSKWNYDNNDAGLQDELVLDAEWDKSSIQELDITANDLSQDCLIELLCRIPALKWLSAGQIDGFTDQVTHYI